MPNLKIKKMMPARFDRQDVELTKRDRKYDGFFKVDAYKLKHELFAGHTSDEFVRELFERGEAAAVLLYDPIRNKVVLVEQFRIGALEDEVSPWLLELVAGIVEEGESPEEVASREAQEEAGCEVSDLEHITSYWVSPGGTSEKIHLYCAHIDSEGLGGIHGLADENEDILVHVVSCEEAFEAVACGRINNAATIIALQWLQLKQKANG